MIAKSKEAMLRDWRVTVRQFSEKIPDFSKAFTGKFWQTIWDMSRFGKGGSQEYLRKTINSNVLKRPANFLKPTESIVKNSWIPLSLETRSGSTTRYQKRKNNPIRGNIYSCRNQVNSNKHYLSAKWWRTYFGTGRGYCCTSSCLQGNNQCRLLLSDVAEALPHDSKQEERHTDEMSAFASGQRSSAYSSCHNQSHQPIWIRYYHKLAL